MKEPECVGTGPDDAAAGSVTTSGWQRWCLLLAATAASTFLFSLSATQAFGQLNPLPDPIPRCYDGTPIALMPGYTCPPLTAELRGAFGAGGAMTSYCPAPQFVVGVIRFADPINTYTRGVQAICSNYNTRGYTPPPVIGATSAISATSRCGSFIERARGIYGRAGDVIDGLGVRCSSTNLDGTVAELNSPYVGGFGGFAQGPFTCPPGMFVSGLVGKPATYGSGYNVITLRGVCKAATTGGVILGDAAPTGSARTYRASGSHGPVKFSMLISKALDKPSSWNYAIDDLVVATSCSRSARVPGAIVAAYRRRVSQHPRFDARAGGFRVTGRVSGPLTRPKVRATVTVLKGACRGEVVKFTAVRSR